MKSFTILWLGELVSLVGSRTSGFALSVWVYQLDRRVTSLALVALAATLPGALIAPILGPVIDRIDRRLLLLWGNCARAALVAAMTVAAVTHQLGKPLIYGCEFGIAVFAILSTLTLSTVTALLVSSNDLNRANGMLQTSQAVGEIAAPLLGGILLSYSSIAVVLGLDFCTFMVAIVAVTMIHLPDCTAPNQSPLSLFGGMLLGWRYLLAHRCMRTLLIFITAINFLLSMSVLLFRPLVLAVATPRTLGFVLSFAACGMLIGAVAMSAWGGVRPRPKTMLYAAGVCGIALALAGASPSIGWLAAMAFVCFSCAPVVGASNQAIWQAAVPVSIQGRVFSIGVMLNGLVIPLSQILAGPLADRWFEPALRNNGVLAGTAGKLIGTGPGRGIGLMLMMLGIIWTTAVLWTLNSRDVRELVVEELVLNPSLG